MSRQLINCLRLPHAHVDLTKDRQVSVCVAFANTPCVLQHSINVTANRSTLSPVRERLTDQYHQRQQPNTALVGDRQEAAVTQSWASTARFQAASRAE